MALGLCLYWGDKNYDAALKEFELAAATSPNNAEIYDYVGGIYRRQGRWREAVASFERALSLDPRNAEHRFPSPATIIFFCVTGLPLLPVTITCWRSRRTSRIPRSALLTWKCFGTAIPLPARNILQNIPAGIDPDGHVALARWDLAMLERDYAAAEKILTDSPSENFSEPGDARKHFTRAAPPSPAATSNRPSVILPRRCQLSKSGCATIPTIQSRHADLGLLYAYMQRKEDAIREGRRAIELEPESQNAFHGAAWAANLALVYALVGEQDQAITLIERLLSTPGAVGSASDVSRTSRSPTFVCAGNGTRCEAIRVSRNSRRTGTENHLLKPRSQWRVRRRDSPSSHLPALINRHHSRRRLRSRRE